jgi:hypothetical protein
MKRAAFLLALTALLLLAGSALAMYSANYRLDWFAPLTGGGGGAASSDSYAINLTLGQSAVGTTAGTSYAACLGYWCGTDVEYSVYLPLVVQE